MLLEKSSASMTMTPSTSPKFVWALTGVFAASKMPTSAANERVRCIMNERPAPVYKTHIPPIEAEAGIYLFRRKPQGKNDLLPVGCGHAKVQSIRPDIPANLHHDIICALTQIHFHRILVNQRRNMRRSLE